MSSVDTALAAVDAATFAYSTVGARLSKPEAAAATAAFTELRAQRDVLRSWLEADGSQPSAPPAAYQLGPLSDAAAARTAALTAEEAVAAALAVLVRDSSAARRTSAASWLTGSAVRAVGWRVALGLSPTTVAFPGLSQPG